MHPAGHSLATQAWELVARPLHSCGVCSELFTRVVIFTSFSYGILNPAANIYQNK